MHSTDLVPGRRYQILLEGTAENGRRVGETWLRLDNGALLSAESVDSALHIEPGREWNPGDVVEWGNFVLFRGKGSRTVAPWRDQNGDTYWDGLVDEKVDAGEAKIVYSRKNPVGLANVDNTADIL